VAGKAKTLTRFDIGCIGRTKKRKEEVLKSQRCPWLMQGTYGYYTDWME
jgi:hypothetical protein